MGAKKIRSYRDLEIWRMARELVVVVHKMTLEKLPKFELYEEGSQIRRSSNRILKNSFQCHAREGGHPENQTKAWIPAFAGMTNPGNFRLFQHPAKSISSNIVEGHGRRRYKNDYIKFLTYALASCDETRDHIEMLYDTGSLSDKAIFDNLTKRYDILGRSINNFLQGVIAEHRAPKDQIGQQIFVDEDEEASSNKYQTSNIP